MMSCDTNVLYAALDAASRGHAAAVDFLQRMQDSNRFGICELVLIELYGLLRNPTVSREAYDAVEAARVIQHFRSHPRWLLFDYPGPQAGIMKRLWTLAANPDFPYKRIYDARLALTLRHHGVAEFATRNVRDFQGFGFKTVWDPLAASAPDTA
jgi:toxin-antitoxin system PIN domain toxin